MPDFTEPRQAILAQLRNFDFSKVNDLSLVGPDYKTGYTRAVINVCRAIESTAKPDELWEAGKTVQELTPQDNIGEHLAATRRLFGLIA